MTTLTYKEGIEINEVSRMSMFVLNLTHKPPPP